jgi:uncharacterized protein (DUF885 family)
LDRRELLRSTAHAAVGFGILARLKPLPAQPWTAPSPFVALRDEYFVRAMSLNPVTSTYLGGSGYSPALADTDGRLRDWSESALAAERTYYRSVQQRLAGIDPSALDANQKIDYAVLGAQLGFLLHQQEVWHQYQRSVDSYVAEPFRGIDWQIQQMVDGGATGGRGSEAEWALVIKRASAIPAYLETAKANLLAGKAAGNLPDWRMIERDGMSGSKANSDYFATTLPALAKVYLGARPFAAGTLAGLTAAGAAAAKAYEGFAQFLASTFNLNGEPDRFALGEKEYEWRTANCLRDPRSAAQLYEYGAAQVALFEEKMFQLAGQISADQKLGLSFGTEAERRASVRAVMAWLSKDSPRSDDELLQWYVTTGERAVAYGRAQGLFDIPADYRLEVTPTPPVLQSTIDAAYYPAPPFKKTGVGRFYLTPTGNDPAALKLNSRASVADTAVHEGFPGHDWNYKYMTEHAAEISNIRWLTPGAVEDSSAMWQDSMASEGWALYSEELMAEPVAGGPNGFYNPGERLYELQGQLLRAVRVRVDVGIHTGRMTFNEAIDYFLEHVEFSPGARMRAPADDEARAMTAGANRAIYRYSKWPTQAITYNLGMRAILSLRADYQAKRGNSYSEKEFHERFMRVGSIPMGFFRDTFLA